MHFEEDPFITDSFIELDALNRDYPQAVAGMLMAMITAQQRLMESGVKFDSIQQNAEAARIFLDTIRAEKIKELAAQFPDKPLDSDLMKAELFSRLTYINHLFIVLPLEPTAIGIIFGLYRFFYQAVFGVQSSLDNVNFLNYVRQFTIYLSLDPDDHAQR